MKVYSIYDNKALTWGQPYFAQNKHTALRSFSDAVNNPESPFGQHPGDYVLYEIGTWDEFTGQIAGHETNENLGMAADYIKTEPDLRAVQ